MGIETLRPSLNATDTVPRRSTGDELCGTRVALIIQSRGSACTAFKSTAHGMSTDSFETFIAVGFGVREPISTCTPRVVRDLRSTVPKNNVEGTVRNAGVECRVTSATVSAGDEGARTRIRADDPVGSGIKRGMQTNITRHASRGSVGRADGDFGTARTFVVTQGADA
jgi:hypothetical protein